VDIHCTATDLPLSKVSRGQGWDMGGGGADHGVMESISSCRGLLESQKCESSEESWKEQTKGRGGGGRETHLLLPEPLSVGMTHSSISPYSPKMALSSSTVVL
jgi:hypothetical protein